ncbi:DUF6958 family protein [Virgibacillus sediminis]|uniref:DUF6958 family protein n=1 Tax=Virgibacillus sediminis TaxID=202260 RepID=A0ABV7A7E9_9BACI
MEAVTGRLKGNFKGSPSWHCTAVKLDLEARGIIQRVNSGSPQILHWCKIVSSRRRRRYGDNRGFWQIGCTYWDDNQGGTIS